MATKNRLEQQMDTLDYTDIHYDRKNLNLQRRYDDQYDIMVSIESRIDELEPAEKRELMRAIIERVDLYPERRADGCWLRNIVFSFAELCLGSNLIYLRRNYETQIGMD